MCWQRYNWVGQACERGIEDLRVDNVDNTTSDQDVGVDDLGVVDVDATVLDGKGQVVASQGSDAAAVLDRGTVVDGAVDDVVFEDTGQSLSGEVTESGANRLKGCVVWCKDSYILETIDDRAYAELANGTGQGGQVRLLRRDRDLIWD